MLLGVIGAVVLLAAMVGVFWYEGSGGASTIGSKSFAVSWASADNPGPSGKGTSNLGASGEAQVNVSTPNLTRLAFTVTWAATNGKDTVKVTITPPAGVPGGNRTFGPASSGRADIAFDLPTTLPATSTIFADTESLALARLAPTHTATLGEGAWKVVVAFTDASGVDPLPMGPPLQQDQTVAWDVKSVASVYAPTLTAK
ncbi:MAG: hypothetical protein ACYDCK_07775 [Thermoplasmatota archaeon]